MTLNHANALSKATRHDVLKDIMCYAELGGRGWSDMLSWGLGQPDADRLEGGGSFDWIAAKSTFEVVFAKSVLAVWPGLAETLLTLHRVMKPAGRSLFSENSYGLHFLCRSRHRRWDYPTANYLTPRSIDLFNQAFSEVVVKHRALPPVYALAVRA